MKIWFMYGNHTFAKAPSLSENPRWKVKARIMELFEEDRCGHVFARNVRDETVANYTPKFNTITMRCEVDEAAVDGFLDMCDEHMNWETRG